ncbi:MAG: four helix bundle protein [Candidatus Marinimicrobia bacterium]|nr:four helix bundle protein [Candidatus Neomarinimicrobiota bacterium]
MDTEKRNFIPLKDLEVYKLARELSVISWEVYKNLDWRDKKIFGDQFMEAIDSVGANIAEGYSRFHYLDRIKFYYNARASLAESCEHWLELICERVKINKDTYDKLKVIANNLSLKLNNFISSNYGNLKNSKG